MSNSIDPTTARALDCFTVPPLSDGFADRVMAGVMASPSLLDSALPELPTLAATRRNPRGGWRRSGIILAGMAAFSLVSAAAAATGIFGDNIRSTVRATPVLGTIIASVAPERPKLAHKVKPARVVAPVIIAPPIVTIPEIAPVEVMMPPPADLRNERIAQRIATRLERRADRRAALGLPPRPLRKGLIARKLRHLPPEERAKIRQRIREIRAERRAQFTKQSNEIPAVEALDSAGNPQRAERKQMLREMRERRRARRELRRLGDD